MNTARHSLPAAARKALLISSVSLCAATASAYAAASVPTSPTPKAAVSAINEGFDDVNVLLERGWIEQNNSEPLGTQIWYQGLPAQFSSYDGDLNSYIAANYHATSGDGVISDWLVTPLLAFNGGATASFFTRSASSPTSPFVDRLQVRLCIGADCSNVGTSATDVGDFDTVLLDINPNYLTGGYPSTWTQQILSDLPSSGTGRIAMRYFVESGGPSGDNSNYIGIDRFAFDGGGGATVAPSVIVSFTPSTVNAGNASTLKIMLQNPTGNVATVTSALVHAFPAGVTLASAPQASTTCDSGSITTTATSITLADGAGIPASGACSITVDVASATAGDYTDTILAGALVTDQGSNANDTSATLHVLPPLAPPTASVTPGSLSFTATTLGTASGGFSIANATNTHKLDYSIAAQDEAGVKSIPLTAGRRYSTQDGGDIGIKRPLAPEGMLPSRLASPGIDTQAGTSGDLAGGGLVVRAAGPEGSAGSCTGPIVSWITATPTSGSVSAGQSADIVIGVNPLADNLQPGNYSADVCVTTNDPSQPVIPVPVSLTVTAADGWSGCGSTDSLFCDGFDGAGTIVRRQINQALPIDADGLSLNLATGAIHPYNPNITSDDINLYNGDPSAVALVAYWYADVVPPDFTTLVGGVVDDFGFDYAVLHSGDVVGPDSNIKAGNRPMLDWIYGEDGYIGIAFYNEGTGMVNYGYIHLATTDPTGFPANMLDYAFDSSGAPITIP